MIRLLNDGTWSKPPFITGARQVVARHLAHSTATATLGSLAEFVNGTSYDKAQLVESGGLPIIRISNVSDPTSPHLRSVQDFDDKFLVDPGDLLVSWSASFKSLIWPGEPGVLNQHIFRVRERDGVDKAYLRHMIEASLDEMLENAVGMGMKHLRRADFLGHEVPLPDLADQAAIGAYLDAVEQDLERPALPSALDSLSDEVSRLGRALAASQAALVRTQDAVVDLDTLRQRVLDDAVRGRLTERDPSDEPASALLARIADEKTRRYVAGEIRKPKTVPPVKEEERPFEVPETWVWAHLAHVLREPLANGRSVRDRKGGFPVMRLSALHGAAVDTSDTKEGDWTAEEAENYVVEAGDLLMARGNGSLTLVGRGSLVGSVDRPVAFPDTMIRARPDSAGCLPEYLLRVWDSPLVRDQIESRARSTSGLHKVNQGHLLSTRLPLPPVRELTGPHSLYQPLR